MRQQGFSLMELVIVLTIIGILSAIAGIQFNQYSRKAGIEAQMKTLYTDLMDARAQALLRKEDRSVKLASAKVTIHPTSDGSGAAIFEKPLKYGIVWSDSSDVVVAFDTRGLADVGKTICVDPADSTASVDSIVISKARIQLGKRNAGAGCTSANIVVK